MISLIDMDVLEHRGLAQLRLAAPRGPLEGHKAPSSLRFHDTNHEIHVHLIRRRSLIKLSGAKGSSAAVGCKGLAQPSAAKG